MTNDLLKLRPKIVMWEKNLFCSPVYCCKGKQMTLMYKTLGYYSTVMKST